MPTIVNRLKSSDVERETRPGYHADGAGLYLQVGRAGAKSWVYRFTLVGRTREMGLGSVATLNLAEARLAARGARALKERGIDPIEAKRAQRTTVAAAAAHLPTFREEAESYVDAHTPGWKNAKHAKQWRSTLETYAYPKIGHLPVAGIDTGLIVQILEPIWFQKTETASRVRGRIEKILDRAKTRGHRSGENPARWRGHFENLLPARSKVAPVQHHRSLPYSEIGDFMALLCEQRGTAARALELTILCATRTIETIGAKAAEFDFNTNTWSIPGKRMKKKRDHRVPLSPRAVELLLSLDFASEDDFVFPSLDAAKHISDGSMLALLGRMEHGHITTHGFRSSFKDWAMEQTTFAPELSEMALAHIVQDKTEAAYRRGDLFDKRRRLMEAWAEFCAKPSVRRAPILMRKRN